MTELLFSCYVLDDEMSAFHYKGFCYSQFEVRKIRRDNVCSVLPVCMYIYFLTYFYFILMYFICMIESITVMNGSESTSVLRSIVELDITSLLALLPREERHEELKQVSLLLDIFHFTPQCVLYCCIYCLLVFE